MWLLWRMKDMFISKLYYYLKKKDDDVAADLAAGLTVGLVAGLAAGLVFGLTFGLTVGLTFGLAAGLVFGLTFGLAAGLTFGLAAGLTVGLAAGLAFGLTFGLAAGLAAGLPLYGIPTWIIFTIALVLMEVLFIIEARLSKQKYSIWMTIGKKFEALFDVLLIEINLLNLWWLAKKIWINWDIVITWIGYVGVALVCLGAIIGYLYLNKWMVNKGKKGR